MTASIGSHRGSFGKGGPDFGIPSHVFAAQFGVIDLAFNRPRAQHGTGGLAFRCQLQQLILKSR